MSNFRESMATPCFTPMARSRLSPDRLSFLVSRWRRCNLWVEGTVFPRRPRFHVVPSLGPETVFTCGPRSPLSFTCHFELEKFRFSSTSCPSRGPFALTTLFLIIQYESSIAAKVGVSDFSALDNAKYVKICLVVRIGPL
jgi:hypothetical protein